jgi:hypothetical protein
MPLNVARVRQCLQNFDFRTLFVQELGWDKHPAGLTVAVDGATYSLQPIAEKRGFQVFACPSPDGGTFPDHPTRSKIERQVAKSAHEHIIIYTDLAKTAQKWQWVRRELGRPLARREYDFFKGHTGELLAQKLQYLAVELDEEEDLTLVDVTRRARQAFDVDRVTRRFYDRFKTEHATFLKFIKGITATADAEWYASVMLNRLMFVYFIQKKGFLDGDPDYLRNRMKSVRQQKGKDKFLSFYRYFLLRLFHEGLGQPPSQRKKDLDALLGEVPYLNGGLFDVHELERSYPDIQIADDAFERLFDFFDAYQWHLDERPLRADNEINPDVLGYIFEKYINQKQMGAYYTKEDITGYIARNTVVPFLFNAAEKKCAIAFKPDSAVWRLLRDNPDRYIHPAVCKGVDLPLPPEIAAGVGDVSKRGGWNKPAAPDHALPTETWREHVARRQRCIELRTKLKSGEVRDINDLITLNLDICQFAGDVIDNCEGPELLRAFWHAIKNVSVLDPTCGSGAFLFAALNILEPLYEACLERMRLFLEDLQRSVDKHHPEKFSDFRKILEDVARHPNHRYFILKSIIIGNLYGVDIMEEAVEICKLRLFLKLVAQVENAKQVEPLPDIDFNIRPGNTLVGFASLDEVKKTLQGNLGFGRKDVDRIVEEAEVVDRAFAKFRQMQTEHGMDAKEFSTAKAELRRRLDKLRDELDQFLAGEYGVDAEKPKLYEQWRKGHQPFHWLAEFYGIMAGGGFDVVIGNPPYKDLKSVRNYEVRGYSTLTTGNLYSLVEERSLRLTCDGGRLGFIVLISSVSTEGYAKLQDLVLRFSGHFSSFDDRPSRLFDGLEHIQQTIHLIEKRCQPSAQTIYTTECYRWNAQERQILFPTLEYERLATQHLPGCIAKISRPCEHSLLDKLWKQSMTLGSQLSRTGQHTVYYSRKVHNFLQALDFVPEVYDGKGKLRPPSELKELCFRTKGEAALTFCILNSTLFRWFINAFTDCRHVNRREVEGFPVNLSVFLQSDEPTWKALAAKLTKKLRDTSEFREMRFKHDKLRVRCIIPKFSKPIIDEIDQSLAKHYGFTDEELDFIINYDIKYRMGQDGGDEDGEE